MIVSDDRRAGDTPWGDTTRILAVVYILGFLAFVGGLFFVPIPTGNKDLILTIAGIMSTIQAAIIGYYFGSSKAAEASQRTIAASKDRADTTLQEIAKAPIVAATVAAEAIKTDDVQIDAKGAAISITGAKP